MRIQKLGAGVIAASAVQFACCGGASAQEVQQTPPVLAVSSAGLDSLLSGEKDRALRDLLHLIAPRLSELPAELGRLGVHELDEVPEGLFETLWLVGTRPQAMELRLNLGRLRNQQAPIDVRWGARTDDLQGASDTIGVARSLLQDAPVQISPSSEAGTFVAQTPALALYFGSTQTDGGPLVFLSTEPRSLPDLSAKYVDLPDGVEQVLGVRFDLGQLTPVIGMPIGMAPPVVGELLMEAGLVGWDATRLDMALGYDDAAMHTRIRLTGAARAARMFAADTDRVLSAADFALVPGDATMASLGLFDLSRTWKLAQRVLQSLGVWEDIERELADQNGPDMATIERIVSSLGDTWVVYQSETTGGGEFSSLVMSVSIRDRATLEQAVSVGVDRFNAIGRDQGRGYARVRSWEHNGTAIYSVNTPGLPIPIEPTVAISGDRLLVAMSVPSLFAAIEQQQNGLRSLAQRGDIMDLAGGSFDGLAGFSYTDTERYARRGYGALNHLMAGLANGVRSPLHDREPYSGGSMMPSFSAFTSGIVPTVNVTRWDGEDLIMTGIADRSVSVHLAARLAKMNVGAMSGQLLPLMGAGGVSGFHSARAEAQAAGDRAVSVKRVRAAAARAVQYASDTGEGLPGSVDALVEAGLLAPSELRSPFGSMMDGTPDIVIRTDAAGQEPDLFTTTVLALDRSALAFTGSTAVAFMDTHVEWLDRAALEAMLARPENEGARERFGF